MMFRRCIRLPLVALTALSLPVSAQPLRAGDDLLGLWGAEPQLGPQVNGTLTLQRQGRRWNLRVAGFEATAEQHGDSAIIALPGGQGTLRIWTGARVPDAFWVQPAGINQPYASPVHLSATGPDSWRGTVQPVPAQFPLYLMVTRADNGALRGSFRNPEVNWPGRQPYYGVSRTGDTVAFTNPHTGKVQWSQPYDSARRTIAFDFDAPIVLTPRTREQAVGFVTRSPSLAPYVYRTPTRLSDGWPVAAAHDAGVNTTALQAIVRGLVDVDPLSETEPRVHSLLVARRGRLVLDEYFRGYDIDMLHDLRSASKTMTSIMVGAAMQHDAKVLGTPIDTNTPVGTSGITLGHLLSHSAGLACNDDDDASPGNEDTMQAQRVQDDWYAFFMALPRVNAPGTTYSYCSAGMNMAGSVIGRATARWLPRVFESWLAKPMNFSGYGINLMPRGDAYSGGGMRMKPRDFLKFGQLYLDGGLWKGVRLVPATWVRRSTARVIGRADGSDDGYGWHRHLLSANGRTYQTYEASGNGGQFLVVVPELQLTVVVTAGNYGQYDVWQTIRTQLLPAVMSATR